MRQFQPNFTNISHDSRAIVEILLYDSHKTFLRVSHDILLNVAWSHFHSYDSQETFLRVSHDICMNAS